MEVIRPERAEGHLIAASRTLQTPSTHPDAFCSDIKRVKRLARGHEQAVSLGATETEIGARFRKMNFSDKSAVGCEDMYSVEALTGPPGSGPDIPVRIAANAIGATRGHVHKDAPIRQPDAIYDVIHSNRARRAG